MNSILELSLLVMLLLTGFLIGRASAFPVHITGKSMLPAMPENITTWEAERTPFENLTKGDVVCWTLKNEQKTKKLNLTRMALGLPQETYALGGYYGTVCHRIIWKNTTNFMTKGDNNPNHDDFILGKENYNYKVILNEPLSNSTIIYSVEKGVLRITSSKYPQEVPMEVPQKPAKRDKMVMLK